MTMHVHLSPEMENYVKGKVASGFYRNSTEVIRDAIRRMQAEENCRAAGKSTMSQGQRQVDARESALHVGAKGAHNAICHSNAAQLSGD